MTATTPPGELSVRANHLLQAGRPDEGARLVERQLAEDPDNLTALVVLAACRQAAGRYGEALDAAGRAATVAPEQPVAHRQAAAALLMLGRTGEAVRAARLARDLAPQDAHGEVALVYALLQAGGTANIVAALEAAGRARELAPEDPLVHVALGDAQRRTARFEAARTSYEQALALAPDDPMALYSLAEMDAGRGRALSASPGLAAVLGAAPADETVVRVATRSARGALWLVTDVASLLLVVASVAAGLLRARIDGPAGLAVGLLAAVAGIAGAAAFLRWRLRALSGPTRALIRQNLRRPTFALAVLRLLVTAVAALLFALDPDPAGKAGIKVFAMPATSLPFILLVLRARNWFAREVSWLLRRGWFGMARGRTTPS
ncbi:tetratricopeptide repeat protein [Pseudosporangium ferrugineum]|uniref:Tetratricopeptide (TPR) repeat protein n=1 Tax=Pseudosporangium ferrugineum TaxID=439699 RepID=A0A2T0SEL2_9ACTN|nr:tetratricopeptide repeat protein [Pseudosporangium ferrugineum]PRY31858.1 tetratricopeptide (TPR) repeat protein [Pseudosporangium ferrugineum]